MINNDLTRLDEMRLKMQSLTQCYFYIKPAGDSGGPGGGAVLVTPP